MQFKNFVTCTLNLINARRGGEAARLTLAGFKDVVSGKWANEKSAGKLDLDTEMMCKLKYTYIYIPLKRLNLCQLFFH